MPFILQHIPQQQSISIMQELLEHENLEVRDNCIHALCFLRDRYPLLIIDEKLINRLLLEEARYNNKLLQFLTLQQEEKPEKSNASLIPILKEKIDANLSIIFSLLHIKYPPEEYLDLYGYVNSSDQILRNNAIEYLENSLGNDLKKIIIPMLDMNNIDFGQTKESEEFDEIKIKTFLLENRDQDIRSAALLYFS